MPKVDWGISKADALNFDRSKQFKPYLGKVPPNGTYVWRLTRLQFAPATGEKFARLTIGLELVPQDRAEKAFKGYRIMTFRSVSDRTQFAYVPFLDAIGVSEGDFTDRTIADREGNIQRIGQWRYNADQEILATLKDDQDQHGAPRKDVGWIGPVDALDDEGDDEPDDDEDEEFADDEDGEFDEYDDEDDDGYDEDDEDYDDEPEPAPKRRQPTKLRGGRAGTSGRTRR